MRKNIAIQGIKGSFHHLVAQQYFEVNIEVLECRSFMDVVKELKEGHASHAVMAIENSTAGTILPNYAMIDENQVVITGEHYVPIRMDLMTIPGRSLNDIAEVHSHPMALLQCKEFFRSQPHIKLVEDVDTAEAAQRISRNKLKNIAAIASEIAADIYGLEIIKKGIQTISNNVTRFLILENAKNEELHGNKISLKLELPNNHGNLATVLHLLSDYNLDLTKIQSLPVIETPWTYSSFIDATFQDKKELEKALSILDIMATELKVLGIYKNSRP
ncbi:prephenate dehydratase [Gangjinia marincola]|uniref:prephenate dehydratase n=1 Tax=Gangjinia marincola TaxID=578463 RepID=UPI0031E49523